MSQQLRQQDDISLDRLTAALRSAGALSPAGSVAALTADDMSGGYLSSTVRLTVEYDQPNVSAPSSLVGKFPSSDEQVRGIASFMGMYAREVEFYRGPAKDAEIRVPQCYLADIDAETQSFELLLEDISGAVVHDQDLGCDREDARLALDQAARLHAAYWNVSALDGYPWLNRLDHTRARQWQEMFGFAWRAFVELDGVELRPDQIAIGDTLACSDMAYWMCQHGSPLTLVHTDFHLGNLLFVGSGEDREVVTVDWQMVAQAPALVDVAFFLGRLPTDTRRGMERELVAGYHRALCAGGVTGYSWEACWADYQRWTWFGVLSAVMASVVNPLTPQDLPRYTRKVARFLDQVVDHDALRFLG